eukprot:s1894_g2.t1
MSLAPQRRAFFRPRMAIESNPKLASAYLASCTRQNGAKVAHEVLRQLAESSMQVNVFHGNAILGACHVRDWRYALHLLETFGTGETAMQRDVVSYNGVINVLEKASRWSSALALLRKAPVLGIQLSAIGYSTLLNVDQSLWKMTFHLLLEAGRVALHTGTMGCSAAIRAASGRWRDALQLLQRMMWQRIPADRSSYNSELHSIKSQWQRAAELARTLPPDTVAMNTVINACARAGQWALTLALLGNMAIIQLEADVFSCATALGVLTERGGSAWRDANEFLRSTDTSKIRPNHVTFGTALGCCGSRWEIAQELMQRVSLERLQHDLVMCNSALDCCDRAQRWDLALHVLTRERVDRVQRWDVISFTAAIAACEKSSQWRSAVDLLPQMTRIEVTPDDVCLNAAIDACASAGETSQGWQLLRLAERLPRGARDVSSLPWALARLHCHDSSFVQSVFRDVAQRLPSSNISSKRLALLSWAFAMLGVEPGGHGAFRREIAGALGRGCGVQDLSLMSWGLTGGGWELAQEVQRAAVMEMRRSQLWRQDPVAFADAVLGIVWAWNFAGLLGQQLLTTAREVLLRGARAMDSGKGTRNRVTKRTDAKCLTHSCDACDFQMQSITALRDFYELPRELWQAFIEVAGDPKDDLKLLAALPNAVIAASLERATLTGGMPLTAVQASHVGLVYNLARRIIYTKGGGDWDKWKDQSPFLDQRQDQGNEGNLVLTPKEDSLPERKLKMTQVIDQSDDGEFIVQTEETRSRWYQQYQLVTGGFPPEEEDPTVEQLSALDRRLSVQNIPPFVDFGVWVPFGAKHLRASRFRAYVLTSNGYQTKELPGPSSFTQWRSSFRILRTALIMLDAVSLASLHAYEMAVERLTRTYASAWHLIYAADELARSAYSNRLRARILMDAKAGKPLPPTWDPHRPWDHIFLQVAMDDAFWQQQVIAPALAWIAAGSQGRPRTPAEQLASGFMMGGIHAITPQVEGVNNKVTTESPRGPRRPRRRNGGKGRGNGGLHEEEGFVKCAGSTTGDKSKGTKVEQSGESSYTYETVGEESEEEEEGPDEGDDEPVDYAPLHADSLEEYYKKRTFVFIHHFAGKRDPLSRALKLEAIRQGILLKVIGVEKESGSGDLLQNEPYATHLRWARRGYVDGFHAGFPCSTFSRLRHRVAEGLPGPVRTRSEPYGRADNSAREQQQCDEGTVLASRAINMATAVADRPQTVTIPPVSTLENPPPSDCPDHLSAWELPEMASFLGHGTRNMANFNTCRYESDIELGKRHFKPQRFAGSMLGLAELSKDCNCGKHTKHEPIVGPERSRASAEYPEKLCREYAILAITQLKLMGKEEFLKSRMSKLQDSIDKAKAMITERNTVMPFNPTTPQSARRRSRTPIRRQVKPGRSPIQRRAPSPKQTTSSSHRRARDSEGETHSKRAKLEPNVSTEIWKGGEGKYGTLKSSRSKEKVQNIDFVGGLRDPCKVVEPRANLMSLGLKVRAAWEAFERQFKEATTVAETYGTPDCALDSRLVEEWRARLKKVVGARAPKKVRVTAKWMFRSPLESEILRAWVERGNDPEVHVPRWIEDGAPLGIEVPIEVAGIFPLNTDETDLSFLGSSELEDAATQLSKGEMVNYISVQDNVEEAKVELDRYRSQGYLVDVPKAVVESEMSHGTISRLGLILKYKPEGLKRRIILDLKRSGGNRKSVLPEKLVLPRPRDAIAMMRNMYERRLQVGSEGNYARELIVIDISDAYMSLGLDPKELPHALAPNVENNDFYLFSAMLFGFKTAPLVWSRVAALLARLLQSLVRGDEGQHQVYLDDSLWMLQGTLVQRNSVLSMLLTTMSALGLRVSLAKGERSTRVQWIGIKFSLQEEMVILSLPTKFTEELATLLKSWEGRGMAPLKELRQAAGKLAWLSGILPKARWLVAIFYRVLHDRLEDVASGTEARRREERSDPRKKDGLFVVKQLEQPRQWLLKFLEVAMERPQRAFKLDTSKYPSATIITDASPHGMGAVLLINNKIVKAVAFKVMREDAKQLGFEDVWKTSASQGIVEALSVLLAMKAWTQQLRQCNVNLQVQSDSMIALATTQKLSNPSTALNFIGAEIAVQAESAGIEGLTATHIPGVANTVADYLSRPDKWEWDSAELPRELQGVPIQKDAVERGPEFYHLPTPATAPDLWLSSAAANDVWASLR